MCCGVQEKDVILEELLAETEKGHWKKIENQKKAGYLFYVLAIRSPIIFRIINFNRLQDTAKLNVVKVIGVWIVDFFFIFGGFAGAAGNPMYMKTIEEYDAPDVMLLSQEGQEVQR